MEYTIGTKVFRDWEIVAEIGEGSYGKVYQLRKENFGIVANGALKVIRIPRSHSDVKDALSQGMDEQSVTSYFKGVVDEFMREVAVMSDMKSHPNVVGCQDYDIIPHAGGMGWDILIRMDLLTPLQEYQTRHTMDEAQVRRLGADLCEALVYCQKRGLIHRDIKPGNIFVDELGRFRLGDFGVARTADKTMGGMSKQGTENYMAPEVYLGKEYGPTVDIYSLGMVLYQLMNANRLPFYPLPPAPIEFSHRFEVLKKRMSGVQIPPPCSASEDFAAIILKACSFESKDRYRSASDLLEALKGNSGTQSVTYSAPSAPEQSAYAPPASAPVPPMNDFAPPGGDPVPPMDSFTFNTPTGDETIGPAFAPRVPKAEPQPAPPPAPEFNAPPKTAPGFGSPSAPTAGASCVLGMSIDHREITRVSCMDANGSIRTMEIPALLGKANGMWCVGEDARRCSNAIWVACDPNNKVLGDPSNEQLKALDASFVDDYANCISVYLAQVVALVRRSGMDGPLRVIADLAFCEQESRKLVTNACEKAGLGSVRIYSNIEMSAVRFCAGAHPEEGAILVCQADEVCFTIALLQYGDDVLEPVDVRMWPSCSKSKLNHLQTSNDWNRDKAAAQLFDEWIEVIQDILSNTSHDMPLRNVVLCGDLADIPALRWRLATLLGMEPVVMEHPTFASAEGAAVMANNLLPSSAGHQIMLLSMTKFHYGIASQNGDMVLVLERSTTIPVQKTCQRNVTKGEEFYLIESDSNPDPDDPPIERFTAPFTGKAKFTLWVEADGIVRFSIEPAEGTAPKKPAQPRSNQATPKRTPRTQSGAVNYAKIVKQVLARHCYVVPGKGAFNGATIDKLRKHLQIPKNQTVLLSHDATFSNNGKLGFVLTMQGIYAREHFSKPVFTSWDAFARGTFAVTPVNTCRVDEKLVCWCNSGDGKVNSDCIEFFKDLHQAMKQAR